MTVATPLRLALRMLAAVRSGAVLGVEAFDVTVEVDCTRGLPRWTIVGMPAGSVREAQERVSSALANSGIDLPPRRVTCNLAPPYVRQPRPALHGDTPSCCGAS